MNDWFLCKRNYWWDDSSLYQWELQLVLLVKCTV